MGGQNVTFLNTGLPVILLALVAWYAPLILGRSTTSQRELARAVVTSALIVVVSGAVIFAVIYQAAGINVIGTLLDAPTVVGGYFARLSLFAGIVWAPVLALSWYVLAQDVERRLGEKKARRDGT